MSATESGRGYGYDNGYGDGSGQANGNRMSVLRNGVRLTPGDDHGGNVFGHGYGDGITAPNGRASGWGFENDKGIG